jgi:alkylation response protein AidB-like acyl-CoA dehydrogenase
MDFLPTSDQLDLQRGVRDLLESAFPLTALYDGFSPTAWASVTETGVFSLRTDLELGWAESVLVFEELGRACIPGPLVATFLAAGTAPDGPVAVVDPHGTPLLVSHLDVATSLLVLDDAGARLVEPVTGVPLAEPLDPLSPMHELAAVPDAPGTPIDVPVAVLRREGALLTAALQVGLAARLTELAVEYAKHREQFGKVIGSFQAVKHLCADMFVRTELARAALHAAAVMLDQPGVGDAARAVAGAKLLADEAATTNGRSCIQVHGGMGFTWEIPVHFLLKRAWLQATEFGTADEHAEDLADLL